MWKHRQNQLRKSLTQNCHLNCLLFLHIVTLWLESNILHGMQGQNTKSHSINAWQATLAQTQCATLETLLETENNHIS